MFNKLNILLNSARWLQQDSIQVICGRWNDYKNVLVKAVLNYPQHHLHIRFIAIFSIANYWMGGNGCKSAFGSVYVNVANHFCNFIQNHMNWFPNMGNYYFCLPFSILIRRIDENCSNRDFNPNRIWWKSITNALLIKNSKTNFYQN